MAPQHAKVPEEKRATEYLANERTFLAWVRTSVSVIGLGFIVAKFSVWMKQFAAVSTGHSPGMHTSSSMPVGLAMMIFGALLPVLAVWRYHVVNQGINRGQVEADRALVIFVTVLVVLLAAVMIAYMLATREQV